MFDISSRLIDLALLEDIGSGDITSTLAIPDNQKAKACFIAKEDLVLAGMPFVKNVFYKIDNDIKFNIFFKEGSFVKKNSIVADVYGRTKSLLLAERTSLNILQRLSGISTFTKKFIDKVKDLSVKIVDTRKTMPGMRYMEKYAVRIGGGFNHRFGLFDCILIKDNHIKSCGGIKKAIQSVKKSNHLFKIEIEVKTLRELKDALKSNVDIIMLDNMNMEDTKKAVKIAKGRALLEFSGGVNLDNIRDIALLGVDIISIGALTHSAKAVDISMKLK